MVNGAADSQVRRIPENVSLEPLGGYFHTTKAVTLDLHYNSSNTRIVVIERRSLRYEQKIVHDMLSLLAISYCSRGATYLIPFLPCFFGLFLMVLEYLDALLLPWIFWPYLTALQPLNRYSHFFYFYFHCTTLISSSII